MADTSAAQSFYGRWARLYDWLATAPVVRGWRKSAVDALDLDPGDTVVEMGCGTGANVPYLQDAVGPDGEVVGVDVTRELLDRARGRIAREGWRNVHVAQADATRPPIRRADAVLATFVVGMFADPAAAVDRWCDLTDGRIALLNFQYSDRAWGRALAPLYEGFVWSSSPGVSVPDERPGRSLQRDVESAREALAARTADRRYETFAGGFLGLVSGRVE
ncbi:MAG: class I SAM-dependent methyltransferase [Haloarculaceae archaeon]